MITLPPIEFACLRIFSVVLGVYAGALVTVLLVLLGAPSPLVGGLVALSVTLSGLLIPSFSSFLYRAWNRTAREFARCARAIVMRVYFYVVLFALGQTGSVITLKAKGNRKSMWLLRGMIETDFDSNRRTIITSDPLRRNWIMPFISWAVKTGNVWRCSLIPFIVLLANFECSHEETVPTDIYTLY